MPTSPADCGVVAELSGAAEEVSREFVQRRSRGSGDGRSSGLNPNDEQALAERMMHLLIGVLSEETHAGDALDASSDHGSRFAALGLSAADLIDWIRGLEGAVTDRILASSALDQESLRHGVGQISGWFNALCSHQLNVYEAAHDELAGWYSRMGNDLVSYLVSGTPIDTTAVNSQARALGVEPRRQFRAMAVRSEAGVTPAMQRQIKRRLSAVLRRFEPRQSILVHEQGRVLVSVVPIPEDESRLITELGRLLEDEELRRTLYISVGEGVGELASAGRSCRQALSALEIATHREYRGKVTQCSEVILEVLLAHNRWVSEKIVDTRLSEIVGTPHLIETLRAYVECDMSLQRTAEELFVHPNTVAYRMRQVSKRTGRDMRRVSDLTDLSVAMAALDVIRMRADRADDQGQIGEELLTSS